jgi:hypothetical protein
MKKIQMNDKIRDLKEQALIWAIETLDPDALNDNEWAVAIDKKFAELIVRECSSLNKAQSYELSGVIVDTQDGNGFDAVCLTTVKRVEQYLLGSDLLKHFGVEE